MNFKFLASALVVGVLAAPAVTYANDTTDKAKTAVKDSVITTKIKAEMVKDKTVSATSVKVDTNDQGVVTLSGKAKTQAEADRAVAIAKGVKGVTDVQNNISVGVN